MVALLALLSQLATSRKDLLAHATGDFLVSGPGQWSCSPPPTLPTFHPTRHQPHKISLPRVRAGSVMSLGCPGPGTDWQALGAPRAQDRHVSETLRY